MSKPVEVPIEIYNRIEELRKAGLDMKDYKSILTTVERQGDRVTAAWLHNNMKIYLQCQIVGMVPENLS